MKRLELTFGDGFPFDQEVLGFMQDAYTEAITNICSVVGDMVILSGCIESSGGIANGFVVYQGKIMPLIGGTKASDNTYRYKYNEYSETATYNDANIYPVYQSDFLSISQNTGDLPFTQFTRVDSIKTLNDRVRSLEQAPYRVLYSGTEVWQNPANVQNGGLDGLTIDIPNVGTNQYVVLGSFRTNNANGLFRTSNHTENSFVISIEFVQFIAGSYDIIFDYVIVKK